MKKRMLTIAGLHVLLFFNSFGGICSKTAAKYPFLSSPFLAYYAAMLLILAIYAIGWQQVIKRIPLTLAYANKAFETIWTCLWGVLIFHEHLTVGKLLGICVIIAGVVCYALSEEKGHE